MSTVLPVRIVLLLIVLTSAATAQVGSLRGRVIDSASSTPLSSATVRVAGVDQASRQSGAITDRTGAFLVRGLAPGHYGVTVSYLGYAPFESEVEIVAGQTASINARMSQGALGLNEIVVSASRRPEKITDAPASVSVVSARQVEQQPALTVVDHIKEIPGVDIVQSGLTQSNVVMRGFNNAGSGTLMALTDNRIAAIPSIRTNAYNFIPLVNEDVQQIEVIRGPGAALYGPNTANGVLHTITRSPFSSAGTWFALTGGERNLGQIMARHAGTIGERFGYKISAQYMTGLDWPFVDSAETGAHDRALQAGDTNASRIGARDRHIERVAGEARVDAIPAEDLTAILSFGFNQAIRNIDITGVGAAQVRNWRYLYYQARLIYRDYFVQAFLNQSDAGETYLLRTGEPIVDRSWQFVVQGQGVSRPLERIALTYGADFLRTVPVTDGTITGGNEGSDEITEFGGYLQAKGDLVPDLLQVVGALRVDHHSHIDDLILSPRAALVYTPAKDETFRLTYNRAYSAPTTNDMFMDLLATKSLLFDVRASGVPSSGFHFAYSGGQPLMHSRFFSGALPLANDSVLWAGVRDVIKRNVQPGDTIGELMARYVDLLPPPPADKVGVELRTVNPQTGAFDAGGRLEDHGPIRPTINQSIELGYKGIVGGLAAVSVDLYRSHYTDFVGPLQVITPNVFYRANEFQKWLEQVLLSTGMSADSAYAFSLIGAAKVAGVAGDPSSTGIPLATITPSEATDPTAVMLSARNYGDITLYGLDLGLRLDVGHGVLCGATASYVDKNFFENLDSVSDLALNAPKFKYSVSVGYDNPELGLSAEARFRHVDGYPVRSGVYLGSVSGYSTADLTAGYDVSAVPGLSLTLTVQNLLSFVEGKLSERHAEFVSVPEIGRLAMLRVAVRL